MTKNRLEAFSDGVIAIIITIMVLELKVGHDESGSGDWAELFKLWPVFISYVLSFAYVGIYWNNHHHMIHACHRISGPVLWANLHLLFWLSLMPFTAHWMGAHHFTAAPMALYGIVLFMSAVAYYILARTLVAANGADSPIARALGSDRKGKLSLAIYAAGVVAAFWLPWLAFALYALVACIWFIPDRRMERHIDQQAHHG
jgi:uncharacterized membrane protein